MIPIAKPHHSGGSVAAVDAEASAARDVFAADLISGLSARQTRLLRNVAAEVAAGIPDGAALVEFTVAMFTRLAAEAGWSANKIWISDVPQVALFRLEPS